MNHIELICPSPEFDAAVRAMNKDHRLRLGHELLSDSGIAVFRAALKGKPEVECTARDILNLHWKWIRNRPKMGARVQATVKEGLIPELEAIETEISNKRYMHRPRAIDLRPATSNQLLTTSSEGAANAAIISNAA